MNRLLHALLALAWCLALITAVVLLVLGWWGVGFGEPGPAAFIGLVELIGGFVSLNLLWTRRGWMFDRLGAWIQRPPAPIDTRGERL